MTDNKKEYAIIHVNSYTKDEACYGFYNSKTYKKLDDIIAHFWSNDIKDLLKDSGVRVSYTFNTFNKIYQEINNGLLAVFPINSTTYLSDIKPYIKMGFKIVFMSHKEYKQFKKDYQDFITL